MTNNGTYNTYTKAKGGQLHQIAATNFSGAISMLKLFRRSLDRNGQPCLVSIPSATDKH